MTAGIRIHPTQAPVVPPAKTVVRATGAGDSTPPAVAADAADDLAAAVLAVSCALAAERAREA